MNSTVSFIIPTIGRKSLRRTLESIEERPGDEVIVIKDMPPSGMWGNPQRNEGMSIATGDYLAFIDDDDYYVEDARGLMAEAIARDPNRPILFRIQYPNGDFIWKNQQIVPGNLSTQMILVPNHKGFLHHWEGGRNMADFIFIDKWGWDDEEVVWREEVIVLMGHNDEEKL